MINKRVLKLRRDAVQRVGVSTFSSFTVPAADALIGRFTPGITNTNLNKFPANHFLCEPSSPTVTRSADIYVMLPKAPPTRLTLLI